MSKIDELTDDWYEWVESRPDVIKEMCKKYPSNLLYKLNPGGKRVTLYSYSEDGTVTVDIAGEYNKLLFSRRVFGIDPNDLEECDLPGPEEILGEILNGEQTEMYVGSLRGRKND